MNPLAHLASLVLHGPTLTNILKDFTNKVIGLTGAFGRNLDVLKPLFTTFCTDNFSDTKYIRYRSGDAISIAEGVNKAPGAAIQIPKRSVLKTQPSECLEGCPWDRLRRRPEFSIRLPPHFFFFLNLV